MPNPSKEHHMLEFEYAKTKEPIRFPVGTITGAHTGPTLLVLGGMHGSEFAGIQAAVELFDRTDPAKLKGILKVGTIYNFPAFTNNYGFVVPQDGKNPATTFPGALDGTYSEAMAYFFNQEMLTKTDYFIELHGGDIPEALTPFTMYPVTGNDKVDTMSREMALAYNIPIVSAVMMNEPNNPNNPVKSAYGVAAVSGKPSILCESGQQGILKMSEMQTHLDGLLNVMKHLGMIEGEPVNKAKRIFVDDYTAVRSQHDGMWYPEVQLNQPVKEGEVVGYIRDYWGEDLAEVTAMGDGIVTVIRTSPAVRPGTVLLEHGHVIGRE
jgi:uncharacterized protein